jgi:paraquat-inducible protein B
MSKQASKTTIGAFVVGALVLAVVGVLMFGSGKFLQKRNPVVMYFEGSVSGLSVGAPVVFRGVKIGSVTDIRLLYNAQDQTFRIPVYAELQPERATLTAGERDTEKNYRGLIEKGLRAQLISQSFVTGQLMVALDLHPEKPAEFHGDGKVPEIPTVPTMLQELAKKLQDLPLEQLVKSIAGAAEGVDKLVNSQEIKDSLLSLNETMRDIRHLAGNLNQEITGVVRTLDTTLKDYGKLAKTADAQVSDVGVSAKGTLQDFGKVARGADEKIALVANSADAALKEYGKLARDVDKTLQPVTLSLEATLKSAQAAAKQAEKTLTNTQAMTAPDSPVMHEVTKALQELSSASRSIRVLAEYLERHPEALIHGKGGSKGR